MKIYPKDTYFYEYLEVPLIIFMLVGLIFLQFVSCKKTNDSVISKNPRLKPRTTIVEEHYLYEGNAYTLEFYEDDTTGIPINTEVEDDLIDAIGLNDVVFHYIEGIDTTFITNDDVGNEWDDSDTIAAAQTQLNPIFATFYEHINYGGNSFTIGPNYNSWRIDYGSNTCSDEYKLFDLPSGFNDVISSIKFHQSGDIKVWFDLYGWTSNNKSTAVQFAMFRNRGCPFNPSGCYIKTWTMNPRPLVDDPDWAVPNLKKERWGAFWPICNNMNDNISSIGIKLCKVNECNGACYLYFDPF